MGNILEHSQAINNVFNFQTYIHQQYQFDIVISKNDSKMNSGFYTPIIMTKNKKYYKHQVKKRDKENLFHGNKTQILNQLSQRIHIDMNDSLMQFQQQRLSNKPKSKHLYDSCDISQAMNSIKNQVNFYKISDGNEDCEYQTKQIKKQLIQHLSLFCHTEKIKRNLYGQFVDLAKQSGEYLDFYHKTYAYFDDSIQKEINRISKILLCVLNNHYKSFNLNSLETINRVYLSFDLNPMNEFNFIDWQKFSKLRKLMSAEASRMELNQFICNYFFFKTSSISKQEFWIIFSSVFKKLSKKLPLQVFNRLINRLKLAFQHQIKLIKFDKESFKKYLISNNFLWSQFVKMIFTYE